ncbi:hypothetical protein [Virgibacillus ihumii]|nr:hypothetical protein [Virgibacillus ihumii]
MAQQNKLSRQSQYKIAQQMKHAQNDMQVKQAYRAAFKSEQRND